MEGSSCRIQVLVGEDHGLMLEAIVGRLAADPDMQVLGTAVDGQDLVYQGVLVGGRQLPMEPEEVLLAVTGGQFPGFLELG